MTESLRPTVWRVAALLVGKLPWHALAAVGALLGVIAGSLLRIRRTHVQSSMRIAGITRPGVEARAMYRSLGRSAIEFLWLAARGQDATSHVVIETASQSRWRDAVAKGRGVVIAASHTGNWDLAACAIAHHIELLVVTKHLRATAIDAFWQTTRAEQGVTLTPSRGALSRSLNVLRRGGAVAMMIDQVPESMRHAVEVDFLGQPASLDRAPATLAARAGAPLIVAAAWRDATGEHVLQIIDVLMPPERASRAWIEQATVAAANGLGHFVRAHPSQWLWLHRRWRPAPSRPRAAGRP